ncbi:MAG TPA: glutamyl-tRNA reductase [Candidatus Acidoferrales bacterium]|nr:glutamyl-tRNA reductase [Candidatus Acidoferrales bacterium]
MEIVLIGLSHRTAAVETRERVAFNSEQARRAAGELRSRGILEESLVLSTCNRSELYGVSPEDSGDSAAAMEGFLVSFHRLQPAELDGCLYRHRDTEAVRHLFRVSAGLDSMLLGEAEILGQVREAYRLAFEHGATGPVLNRLFQGALEVGKRARAETDIGARPVSVAFAGVKLAERVFGSLRGHQALILGAGAMSEQVVEYMRDRGIARILVANRSAERAQELAHRIGGEAVAWDQLSGALEWPQIVVSSVGGAERVLTRAMIERAMAARGNRAMFLIDLGVPRNMEASIGQLYNVYLYDIDDLTEIVDQNRRARESEVPRVEVIIEEHIEKFQAWQASVHSVALLEELRAKLKHEREDFLRERLGEMQHLSPGDRERVARLAEDLLDRVLLQPVERLRGVRGLRRKLQSVEALRDLFRLDKEKP